VLAAIEQSHAIDNALTAIAVKNPSDSKLQFDLSFRKANFGLNLRALGNYDDAFARYTDARATVKALADKDPSNPQWRSYLWTIDNMIGDLPC
jgi:hypothetical protein